MKKIIVNYAKGWDITGCVYEQTIKLDKKLLRPIQKELIRVLNLATENIWTYTRDTARTLNIDQVNGKRCIGITNLAIIKGCLYTEGLDVSRILTGRNTIIKFY